MIESEEVIAEQTIRRIQRPQELKVGIGKGRFLVQDLSRQLRLRRPNPAVFLWYIPNAK